MLPDWHRIVDLTQPVTAGMVVYPGDPPVEVEEVAHHSPHGFAVARLALNDHAGTHMETQYHLVPGRTLADEPPERFLGRACVMPVTEPTIDVDVLVPYEALIAQNPSTLLCTGYAEAVAGGINPDDPSRPVVSLAALAWLCERGMTLLGIDAFDFDSGPPYPGHRLLFERQVIVIEGLVGLRELVEHEVTLLALPLKVRGTGASPCRVLALIS